MTDKELTAAAPSTLAAILSDPERLQAIPVETVERLFRIDKEIRSEDARKAFYSAMNAVQGEIRPVGRQGYNQHTKSKYAVLEDVQRMLNPILTKHGFSPSASTVEPIMPDTMRICLTVRHVGGHVEKHYMDAAVDDVGPGGRKSKTALHGAGSTFTYCERLLKSKVFNVTLTDNPDDDDGNRGGEPETPVSDEQAANLQALAEEVGADATKFLKYMRAESFAAIPAAKYAAAVTALESKRNAN